MKNRYTVVVKEITSSNGDYNRKRFNNVSPKIIDYLLKNKFSFKVGIADNTVNRKSAENYIEVYEKSMFGKSIEDILYNNPNEELYNKLKEWSK